MRRTSRIWVGIFLLGLFGATTFEARAVSPPPDPSLIVTCNLTNNAPGGQMLRYQASNGQFIAHLANLTTPRGVAMGPDGSLYVCSLNSSTVLRYDPTNGNLLGQFGADHPSDITFGPDGMGYLTSGVTTSQVLKFNPSTGLALSVFASGNGLAVSDSLTFGPDGNLYVGSNGTNGAPKQVLKFNGSTGQFISVFTADPELKFVDGLAFGPTGDLFVSDGISDTVWRFNAQTGARNGSVTGGHLDGPGDITFGPDSNLYVTSGLTDDVQQFNGVTGAFLSTFASGNGLDGPTGLAFTPEPSTGLLAGAALLLLGRRTRQRKSDYCVRSGPDSNSAQTTL